MMKFEDGYTVETVFDGSKLGIEPYSVEVSPNGELLVLDSVNSNLYKISTPLSRYSRPKLVAGSPEGYSGHIDGRPREARMNHPKGITMDDRGNIYVADTINMVIRKISDAGVTTIAGGKLGRGGHVDGPSEDAKFSNDFDIVYVASSCSLLVIDRGDVAIREIQLRIDDCSYQYQYDTNFHLGIAVLAVAAFLGYMLALLQYRVRAMFSSSNDSRSPVKKAMPPAPYQRSYNRSVRPPLIPTEDETEKPDDDGFFGSMGRFFLYTGSTMAEIVGGIFTGFRKKPLNHQYEQQPYNYNQPNKRLINTWPMQDSYVIPDEDEPPPPALETRTPPPKRTYQFMSKEMEKTQDFKQNRSLYHSGWEGNYNYMQQPQQKQQQHHQRHYATNPQTHYKKSSESNEIVFGAVQEQDGRREAVVIKAVDYADPAYNHHNIRSRMNYMAYSHDEY